MLNSEKAKTEIKCSMSIALLLFNCRLLSCVNVTKLITVKVLCFIGLIRYSERRKEKLNQLNYKNLQSL